MNESAPEANGWSGTTEDVATFYRVSEKTISRWIHQAPPLLSWYRVGRRIMVAEDAVIEFGAGRMVVSRRMAPGEAQDMVRRQWREHIRSRRGPRITRISRKGETS